MLKELKVKLHNKLETFFIDTISVPPPPPGKLPPPNFVSRLKIPESPILFQKSVQFIFHLIKSDSSIPATTNSWSIPFVIVVSVSSSLRFKYNEQFLIEERSETL